MSASPEDLMACAEAMLPMAKADPEWRAVCSRAYYAAYQATRAFHAALATPGAVGNATGRHQQLIAQLLSPGISPNNKKHAISKALGKTMLPLLDARIRSDYDIHLDVNQVLAINSTTGARTAVDNSK
ncbi:hypothetical protein ABWH74_001079 [Burkholderia vietnamiensis]